MERPPSSFEGLLNGGRTVYCFQTLFWISSLVGTGFSEFFFFFLAFSIFKLGSWKSLEPESRLRL